MAASPRFPSRLKVGGRRITARLVTGIERTRLLDDDHIGEYNGGLGEIRVVSGMALDLTAEVLMHEILHALINDTPLHRLEGFSENEENIVHALSPRLVAFLADNPAAVQYLISCINSR